MSEQAWWKGSWDRRTLDVVPDINKKPKLTLLPKFHWVSDFLVKTTGSIRLAFTQQMTTAELVRSTKSAFDWTRNSLGAYNINMVTDGVATFFGNPDLPVPSKFHLSVRRFSSTKTTLSMSCKTRTIDSAFPISTMRRWIHLDWWGWFSCHLLRMLGYNERDCYICPDESSTVNKGPTISFRVLCHERVIRYYILSLLQT